MDSNENPNIYENDPPNFVEEVIKCRSCEKPLFSIILLVDSNLPKIKNGRQFLQPTSQKMDSTCPFCNDKSWVKTVNKKVMMAPANNLYFKDVQQEIDGDIINISIQSEIIK